MTHSEPWEFIAARTASRLKQAGHGQQRAVLDEIASQTGYVPSSLRSMVAALEFLEFLRGFDPSLAEQARRLTYVVITIIARWWGHDPEGAREALIDFLRHPEPIRGLADREKVARGKPEAISSPSEPPADAAIHLSPASSPSIRGAEQSSLLALLENRQLIHEASPPHGGARCSTGSAQRRWSGERLAWKAADNLWRRRKVGVVGYLGSDPVVAAFEVKPPSSLDILRDRAAGLILLGHGLRSAVDCVLLILPDADAADVFNRIDLGDAYTNGRHDVWWLYRDHA